MSFNNDNISQNIRKGAIRYSVYKIVKRETSRIYKMYNKFVPRQRFKYKGVVEEKKFNLALFVLD